jgi:DUF4097 and DUF4098 domain-containing protein YvlB
MTSMRSFVLSAFLAAVAALPAQGQNRRDDGRLIDRAAPGRLDTTVALNAGGRVALTTRQGDITVRTGTGNQVVVHAVSDRGRIRFDASPDRVAVDASDDAGDVRLEIIVPPGARVSAESQNGDVSVRGTGGDVSVHTQNGDAVVDGAAGHIEFGTLSGDITASHLKGDVAASSVSGDVTLSDVAGDITASSVSGDVKLRGVTSRSVDAQTTGGDVSFAGAIDPSGRYQLTTHSGDVTLELPEKASAQLTVSTWSGSIDSDFPITLQPGEHGIGVATSKRFTFNIGGGDARISAETFSGDVVIRRRPSK